VVRLHAEGRGALLHRDGVNSRLRATRRARITALTSGGAIPDTGPYRVLLEPEGTLIGTLDEDFAIESNVGDIFQLGNASWRVLKVETGVVRVADAQGMPPSVPFWFGEAPARTPELSAGLSRIREHGRDPEWLEREVGLSPGAARQLAEYLEEGAGDLGAVPTTECVVLERFFDESGGMQLVVHAPFGGRINRAWGLALRKRFCRGFGFELQAAANEEAIVLSLGPQHSFPLDEVFDYLQPERVREVLVQALLDAPVFGTRWRWNATRALLIPRTQNGGRRVPTPLIRMRAEDLLVKAFPQVLACPETLPPGDLPVPWDHPLVRQTLDDCLSEAMDLDGLLDVLEGLGDGRIRKVAVDTREPSAFARGILNAAPYAFLDDAPLEERRTQAVVARRGLDAKTADTLGALDPEAVARVREEAWPEPQVAEELHEALLWMGYVTEVEAVESGVGAWLAELSAQGRVHRDEAHGETRWFAVEASREPTHVLRGRLEALGPVIVDDDPAPRSEDRWSRFPRVPAAEETSLLALEAQGSVLRCRIQGRQAWCERRLLARIHRYTLERLRREIEPVTAADLWRFLARWQHVDDSFHLEGPRGVAEVARKLAGFEIPAAQWEASVLPSRVRDYRQEWLDQLTLGGELVWGRLWGSGHSAIRSTPICLLPREDLEAWQALARSTTPSSDGNGALLVTYARTILEALDRRGPSFAQDLMRQVGLLPSHFEMGLGQLIGRGLVTCDSFGGLRRLITPPSRRKGVMKPAALSPPGRWCRFRGGQGAEDGAVEPRLADDALEFAARTLLTRYGVVFRRLLLRERIPVPWRELVRVYRLWEMRGELRGGRFVQRFAGEQYALPEAVALMRKHRSRAESGSDAAGREAATPRPRVSASDPLNLEGILTPEPRIPSQTRREVALA
jgi:ATP-dependent Lhr-like helicase